MQDNYELLLSRCIKEDLGFKNGKPLAASIIYKCLHHWHAFESERTAIFDYIVDGINDVIKVNNLLLYYCIYLNCGMDAFVIFMRFSSLE